MTNIITLAVVKKDRDIIAESKQIEKVLKEITDLKVTNDESSQKGAEMLSRLKKAKDALEKKRKEITKPLVDEKRDIDNYFKTFTVPVEEAERKMRNKMQVFLSAKAEQERKAQEKLAKQAEKNGVELVEAPIVPQAVQTEQGSVTTRKVWKFEVVDPSTIPGKYFVLDESLIRADVKAGVREIPGVRIYESDEVVVR